MGQYLESVTTRTHPPFTFAFKPDDDDMARMRQQLILEPTLTHAWHEATWRCCQSHSGGGLVVDVGGNFGWFTLYSLALGCRVVVFEPIPAYQEVMRLGVSLNPGFADRIVLHGNVVYDVPGNCARWTRFQPRPRVARGWLCVSLPDGLIDVTCALRVPGFWQIRCVCPLQAASTERSSA